MYRPHEPPSTESSASESAEYTGGVKTEAATTEDDTEVDTEEDTGGVKEEEITEEDTEEDTEGAHRIKNEPSDESTVDDLAVGEVVLKGTGFECQVRRKDIRS